ncbi:hypothetical protein ABPG75_012098 [Micractinium tetrahymenae]
MQAAERSHSLVITRDYGRARLAVSEVPHLLYDLCTAEAVLAAMPWDEVVAQPTLSDRTPWLRYVEYRSARLIYHASAGVVEARAVAMIPMH